MLVWIPAQTPDLRSIILTSVSIIVFPPTGTWMIHPIECISTSKWVLSVHCFGAWTIAINSLTPPADGLCSCKPSMKKCLRNLGTIGLLHRNTCVGLPIDYIETAEGRSWSEPPLLSLRETPWKGWTCSENLAFVAHMTGLGSCLGRDRTILCLDIWPFFWYSIDYYIAYNTNRNFTLACDPGYC